MSPQLFCIALSIALMPVCGTALEAGSVGLALVLGGASGTLALCAISVIVNSIVGESDSRKACRDNESSEKRED